MNKIKAYIGADHAGYALKEQLKHKLSEKYDLIDLTPEHIDGDDYPDIAVKVAHEVIRTGIKAVLVCGSAEGMCIAANKIKGTRAAVAFNSETATVTRRHNDSNILSLSGGQFSDPVARKLMKPIPLQTAADIVEAFLTTEFSGEERHVRRLKKIEELENSN